ncbi:pro-cathepsin H-like [Cydia pomonella]|uniref:pro-cathepsin H-like n=1 Tax=Cydia pomonella TaxID=82600 RepID=UPI002ADDD0F4|nr:pro-cathepsin H-like [Cydia pomonella]
MIVPTFWVGVCLASSAVMAFSNLDKPYYDLDDAENLFRDFIKEHGKVYDRSEYSERLEIFRENLKDINRRNEKYPMTAFKVNHLADMKHEELHIHIFKERHSQQLSETIKKVTIPDGPNPAPDTFDWRTHGKVSDVKNSGKSCFLGSYIFSAIANIESQYAMKYNQCLALSEGQALDCCLDNWGCIGGYPDKLMDEFARKPGIMLEADYPFVGERGYCHEDDTKVAVGVIEGSKLMNTEDEEVLKQKLYEIGPLSVCIEDRDFQFYNGGILEPEKCMEQPIYISGCFLLVGYGEENGTAYWTMKFAAGPEWGEKGYARMRRGVNACFIGYYTATATVV